MFAAIAERPGVQGWALKATSSGGTRQLMENHLYFYLQTYVALRRPVAYREGGFGVFKPPPPEILKISVKSSIA